MAGLKKHGISAITLGNLMFSAGTYYRNLKLTSDTWSGTVLGATSGGGGVTIEPTYESVELDGAHVAIKGGKIKTGEVGKIKMNMTEFTEGVIVPALHLVKSSTQDGEDYTKYETKSMLEDSDYDENIAFVGNLTDGRFAIVIMENALCISALELDPEDKKQATFEFEYECHAEVDENSNLDKLPIYVYFPKTTEV